MTTPTKEDLGRVERQLRRLPDLAAQAAMSDQTPPARRGRRVGMGRLPQGVGAVLTDMDRGREHPALLGKLAQCVRVAFEEIHRGGGATPPLAERPTWSSECTWMLVTIAHWWADDWAREWITGDLDGIERKLERLVGASRAPDEDVPTACPRCGAELDVWRTEVIAAAECPACDVVVGMRSMVSPKQLADRRRQLVAERERAKLDGARRLLGLIVGDTPKNPKCTAQGEGE